MRIFRTSFSSDAHGGLICWFLTPMRTLLHLCVVVMDYDSTNCYISYLSMFVVLLINVDRTIGDTLGCILICMCSDVLFTGIVRATRCDMIVQVPRTGMIIQE